MVLQRSASANRLWNSIYCTGVRIRCTERGVNRASEREREKKTSFFFFCLSGAPGPLRKCGKIESERVSFYGSVTLRFTIILARGPIIAETLVYAHCRFINRIRNYVCVYQYKWFGTIIIIIIITRYSKRYMFSFRITRVHQCPFFSLPRWKRWAIYIFFFFCHESQILNK